MERNEPGELPAYAIESVDKALQILVLLRERRRVRVVDVATELGVARSTAHRLLGTLAHRGFVVRDPDDRSYRGGPELLGMGAVGETDLRAAAHEHVVALAARLRETVNLMVLEGASCRFVDGTAGERPLGTRVRTGAVLPAHIVSGGKALLAELPPREVDALFGPTLRRITPHTIVDLAVLHDELAAVREQGYARNREESEPGLSALAVVVRHGPRAVGALAVSAPTQRLDEPGTAAVLLALRETAAAVAADLGGGPGAGGSAPGAHP